MNARRARQRRWQKLQAERADTARWLTGKMVVIPLTPEQADAARRSSSWFPPTGAGWEVGHIPQATRYSLLCPHLIASAAKAPTAPLAASLCEHACPIEWTRLYWEPARSAIDWWRQIKAKPGAPPMIRQLEASAQWMAASVEEYLGRVATCDCDPGLELVIPRDRLAAQRINTCHEDGCPVIGRSVAGPYWRTFTGEATA